MIQMNKSIDRAIRFPMRAYRYAKRRALRKTGDSPAPRQRREQLANLMGKLASANDRSICAVGSPGQRLPGQTAALLHADFDIESHDNILDLVKERDIDAFYLNRCTPRDLVNLVNFLSVYGLDIPVLIGGQFQCRSLIGYVPMMPGNIVSTAHLTNYFANNYRISDALLIQGSLYEGTRLVDCHQFLIKPDETKVIDIRRELDAQGVELGMYYLEAFHPQLPATTHEFRYFGLYRDDSSGFMAGTHSMPLGTWHNFGRDFRTLTRTYLPNMDGTVVRYLMSGESAQSFGAKHEADTTNGGKVVFTPSNGQGAIETVIQTTGAAQTGGELIFDRVFPAIPTRGGQGFQTLWLENKGFALWHDGDSIRDLRKSQEGPTMRSKAPKSAGSSAALPRQLADERTASQNIPQSMLELYQRRCKYFKTVFPFLGHQYPDLQVVFDFQQWARDLRNFEVHLYTNEGAHMATRPLEFNGTLQTVNLNKFFADKVTELSQGYWTITADPTPQLPGQPPLQYPSDHMLFGFWGDSERIYDSVHSQESINRVAFDLHYPSASDMAKATGRIMARTKKFGPFVARGEQTSWYWLCNAGLSEEKIDAQVKLRLYGLDGSEEIIPMELPAEHAVIISAGEILRQCKYPCPEGTLWVESNDVNIGSMWFVQERNGAGFATDHLTGG